MWKSEIIESLRQGKSGVMKAFKKHHMSAMTAGPVDDTQYGAGDEFRNNIRPDN